MDSRLWCGRSTRPKFERCAGFSVSTNALYRVGQRKGDGVDVDDDDDGDDDDDKSPPA